MLLPFTNLTVFHLLLFLSFSGRLAPYVPSQASSFGTTSHHIPQTLAQFFLPVLLAEVFASDLSRCGKPYCHKKVLKKPNCGVQSKMSILDECIAKDRLCPQGALSSMQAGSIKPSSETKLLCTWVQPVALSMDFSGPKQIKLGCCV